jgi:hypothetical protein
MVVETVPLARVPLARSVPRLLLAPAVALVVALLAIGVGVWVGGWAGIALTAAGLLVVALAALLLVRLLTLSLEIDVGAVRLRWLTGSREYVLARGAVTRVRVRGADAVPLRTSLAFLGWSLGSGRLRGERIRLVRLAPTDTLILVPIAEGRLAIAAASENELVAALSGAARVQQRLEAVASRERRYVLRQPEIGQSAAAPPPQLRQRPPALGDEPPRFMTGIERVELEERLAAQRAAAIAAAEAERRAAEQAAAAAVKPEVATPAGTRPRRRPRLADRPRVATASFSRPTWLSSARVGIGLLVGLPLLGAGTLWLVAALTGQLQADGARLIVLALALAGPAGTLGALLARMWWPRLAPLVTSSALLALVLIGRNLIG